MIKKNKNLESCIQNLLADNRADNKVSKSDEDTELHRHTRGLAVARGHTTFSTTFNILNALVTTASKNANKKLSGYRYSDAIKKFSAYIFMLGGRWCYETLQYKI